MSQDDQQVERLFFALWPPQELARRMRAIADEAVTNGRRLPAGNLHITLAFLGDVASNRLPELISIGDALPGTGFTLELDTLGYWRRPGITWLGPSTPPAAVNQLYDALQGALAGADFPTTNRAFRPHVTLARRSRPPGQRAIEPIEWRAQRMVLVASQRSERGSHYRIRSEWPLSGY